MRKNLIRKNSHSQPYTVNGHTYLNKLKNLRMVRDQKNLIHLFNRFATDLLVKNFSK